MAIREVTEQIHRKMDSDFQPNVIKKRRIMDRTGEVIQKEILQ